MSPLNKREKLQELLMEKHRKAFPTLAKTAYFNYGAQGLISAPALEAIQAYYQKLLEDVPFTMDHTMGFLEVFKKARTHLAKELGVDEGSVALVENTSMGCNMALWGIPWQSGDHLLMSDSEYPGVIATIDALVARFDIRITTFAARGTEAELLDDLERQMEDKTRLVVLSHIPWNTGRILPLKEICHRVHSFGDGQARVLVDGAQSVGVLPLNLKETEVDFYGFTAHKWLCGPEGTGGFYVRPEVADDLKPSFVGPRAIDLDHKGNQLKLWDTARRFEVSTQGTALYAGLDATFQLHARAGSATDRFNRLNQMARRLWEGLRQLQADGHGLTCLDEQPPQAGLVFFRVAQNRKLVLSLEAQNLNIRTIPTEDCVRVSVHYLTLHREIQKLLEGIATFCQQNP